VYCTSTLSFTARHAAQGLGIDYRALPCDPALSGTAVGLALQLWQLAWHLPIQLAAEALTAAIVLRQQEVLGCHTACSQRSRTTKVMYMTA
jgi:hypothetical protein